MKKIGLITIGMPVLFSMLFSYCGEYEMEQTIFIPDATDSNLPAYTEWGYNSFGALYERTYFLAAKDIVPCKITVQNGILTFSLSGWVSSSYPSYSNREKMTLYFSFPAGETMNNYKDLLAIHQKTIDLTDPSCEVKMIRDSKTENVTIISGSLFFQRVQLLRINEKEDRAILSGTFDLMFLRNQLPEVLSKGRFDVGIANLFIIP